MHLKRRFHTRTHVCFRVWKNLSLKIPLVSLPREYLLSGSDSVRCSRNKVHTNKFSWFYCIFMSCVWRGSHLGSFPDKSVFSSSLGGMSNSTQGQSPPCLLKSYLLILVMGLFRDCIWMRICSETEAY